MKKLVILNCLILLISIISVAIILADDNGNSGSSDSKSESSKSDSDKSKLEDTKSESKSEKSEDKDKDKEDVDKQGLEINKEEKEEIEDKEDENEENEKIEDKKDKSEIEKVIIDEQGREVKIKTEIKDGKIEEKITFIDENGNKVTIINETEAEDGEQESVIKKKIVTPDGTQITIKSKTEVEDGKQETTNSIEVNGVEVTTKLSIKEKIEENVAKFKAELSTGNEQEIISPDNAILKALEELGSTNNLTFELKENIEGDKREAVFLAKAINPGKLFGIINTNVPIESIIDGDGTLIKTKKPWWAVFVKEFNKAEICHITNETLNTRVTISVGIPAVKAHLAHGDNIGSCSLICGDNLTIEGYEICDSDTRECTTLEGYNGIEKCNNSCSGYEPCTATESCSDGVVNGQEVCDDGNLINGDGCNNVCQIELSITPNETLTNQTLVNETETNNTINNNLL